MTQKSEIPEFKITESRIKGVFLIERLSSIDARGFFREVWRENILSDKGINFKPIQANHSLSETNVIRGIHAEKWNKLVYPATGKMYVPVIDLRPESPTFGEYEEYTFDCTGNNHPKQALFLPNGIGNSVCAITGPVNYIYLTDAYWYPGASFAVNVFDKDLNINWPIEKPILDEKDKNAPTLREQFSDKFK